MIKMFRAEKDFLDYICDIMEYGLHIRNTLFEGDNPLTPIDTFEKLLPFDAYQLFGIYINDNPPSDNVTCESTEDKISVHFEQVDDLPDKWEPKFRDTIKIDHSHVNEDIDMPEEKDYPIIMCFLWYECFNDNLFRLKSFYWKSLNALENEDPRENKNIKVKWEVEFSEEIKKYKAYQKEEMEKEEEENKRTVTINGKDIIVDIEKRFPFPHY